MQALALTPADLQPFAGEICVQDLRLGQALGFDRPRDVRKIIKSYIDELSRHGGVSRQVGAKPQSGSVGGRPDDSFYLNEAQSLLVTMFSRTEKAAEVRHQIIKVFMAYRHGQLVPAEAAEERRLADPWAAMEHRIAQLERLISLQALTGTPDFAKALTDAEGLFPLRDDNGKLHSQHRFRWWGDLEVREQVIALHRQCTIHKAVALISENMGRDRAPSKSSVGRFWKAYDLVKRIH